jgi:hypothetical protein
MIILAFTCILFGVFNRLPVNNFILPILGGQVETHNFAGTHTNLLLIIITIVVLLGAFIYHFIAAKIMGGGIKAVIYQWQEKKYFDPYEIGIRLIKKLAIILWWIDRGIDWLYESFVTNVTFAFSRAIHRMHAGYYIIYVVWSLVGAFLVMLFVFK